MAECSLAQSQKLQRQQLLFSFSRSSQSAFSFYQSSSSSLPCPHAHKQSHLICCCSSNNGSNAPRPPASDKSGAGKSWVSPDWLTSLTSNFRFGKDESGIPVAIAKLDDVQELLGGALFLPLFHWMLATGPVYRLAAGPRNFVVIGDPAAAKHVLKNYGKYAKGLVSEVSEFLFGSGFAIAEGKLWTVPLFVKSVFTSGRQPPIATNLMHDRKIGREGCGQMHDCICNSPSSEEENGGGIGKQ